MESREYRQEFLSTVRVIAESEQESTVASFVKEAADTLLHAGVIPDHEPCFYTGIGKRNRRLRVDGYALDDYDMTMYLLVADFNGSDDPETLTKSMARTCFDRLTAFVNEALSGTLYKNMEISIPAYDLVETLRTNKNRIRKFSFTLLTDKVASERIESFPFSELEGIPVEYHVWDINRFYRLAESESGRDELWINLCDYISNGIPCLEASSAHTEEYRSILCVIPGKVLADIYDKYGSRLLEGNVRSFLSTKRAVNRKIRETILSKPVRFFAYNNGISATATEVIMVSNGSGCFVTDIKGLQIVNGGQTTASLSNARYKDKASLDRIFVQMKLTEVNDELANNIIPDISRSSNSQNKVSEADFFSNHAFHIQFEKMSRKIFAPSVGGAQYETHWFYERANGQYMQEQSRMRKSEKDRFLMMNPKKQKITKTDLAKTINSWRELPQKACLGAQKNFASFAEWVTDEWEKNDTQFNELFFRQSVALTILFGQIRISIKHQPWYENGYLANLVSYSMAKLSNMLKLSFPNKELDLMIIWNKQSIPDILSEQLIPIYKAVFDILVSSDRLVQNVTEWSKNNVCWERVKATDVSMHPRIEELLIDKTEAQSIARSARKEQKILSGIEAQVFVVEKGKECWINMQDWVRGKNLLTSGEAQLLRLAATMSSNRIPNEIQCKKLKELYDKFLSEGYKEA